MFLPVTVLDWKAQGGGRVVEPAGSLFILNTHNMFEIEETYNSKLTLIFFDNINDVRDGGNRMKISTTVAGIKLAADSDYGGEAVTLNYYPEDDATQSTKAITLIKNNVSYCAPYGNNQTGNLTWLYYCDDAWDVKRILTAYNWIPLYNLLKT
jgi:hypothetical protein